MMVENMLYVLVAILPVFGVWLLLWILAQE